MAHDVHEWFEMNWADITNTTPVVANAEPLPKQLGSWVSVTLERDYESSRFRWCGWVGKQGKRMTRISEWTRERAASAIQRSVNG